jgi:hypothetical protein
MARRHVRPRLARRTHPDAGRHLAPAPLPQLPGPASKRSSPKQCTLAVTGPRRERSSSRYRYTRPGTLLQDGATRIQASDATLGAEAIRLAQQVEVDVILMDCGCHR